MSINIKTLVNVYMVLSNIFLNCVLKDYIKPNFDIGVCNHFGGELKNNCINYFRNTENSKDNCSKYVNIDDQYKKLYPKWYEFLGYVVKYNKYYDDYDNIYDKYEVFHDNLNYIEEHNFGNHTYTLGINKFADMSHMDYLKYISLNKYVSEKDSCIVQTNSVNNYPASIDWREKKYVTPVKDQGQCGSCWAFSTTGAIEGAYAKKTGILKSFSEQQLMDCSYSYGNHGCNGGLMQNAFTYVIANGITNEEAYPYVASSDRKSCESFEPDTYVSKCYDVVPNELELTYAVANQPVSVAIEADSRSFQLYTSGVYNSPDCGTTLDHGVLTVGYGSENGIDYWIVKNSWGTSWGEDGYIKIARNSVASSKEGMCGIAMEASYPMI